MTAEAFVEANFNIKLSLTKAAMSNSVILVDEFDGEDGFRDIQWNGFLNAESSLAMAFFAPGK